MLVILGCLFVYHYSVRMSKDTRSSHKLCVCVFARVFLLVFEVRSSVATSPLGDRMDRPGSGLIVS